MPAKKSADSPTLPSRQDILDFVRTADGKVGKREIARAFNLKGDDRAALKDLLRDMADEGLLERGDKKAVHSQGALPPVGVVVIHDRDVDGELLARPLSWDKEVPPPPIMLAPGEGSGRGASAIGVGDRVLARLAPQDDGSYEARVIKRLGQSVHRILGIFERVGRGKKGDGRVTPVERKSRHDLLIAGPDTNGAQDGDLVMVELLTTRLHGQKRGRVIERLCHSHDRAAIGLIAIHSYGIPTDFPQTVLDETAAIKPVTMKGRTDLRHLPLITIDPEDARDHDDAVHAEADPSEKNPGGWIVTVAIADVAAYVRPGSALDREARKRGNSTYLPDRVIPMLPERLSNDLCSLHEGEDKPCLAVRMIFAADGRKKSHSFIRAMMRSPAALAYDQVQNAIDGHADAAAAPFLDDVLKPLYAAYASVAQAREKRQPLDLDLPEHKVEVGEDGRVTGVTSRTRHDAHRLIEEFMIQANVCAAETLERRATPLLYRVHDAPDREKLAALSEFLATVSLDLAKGQVIRPEHFNRIIAKAKGTEAESLISEVILRSQSQARYSPDNLGHFGLNLRRYAHFTSPIRRYADLIVHRGLIRACNLGTDGLSDAEIDQLDAIGDEISGHERRSMGAERDAVDRFVAAYMSDKIGAAFTGRISGVTRFGLFIKLDETGADGLVPIRTLGDERFEHDEAAHALIGERTGATYRLGDAVEVKVAEAAPMTGGLRFDLLSEPSGYAERTRRGRGPAGRRGRDGAPSRRPGKTAAPKRKTSASGKKKGRGKR